MDDGDIAKEGYDSEFYGNVMLWLLLLTVVPIVAAVVYKTPVEQALKFLQKVAKELPENAAQAEGDLEHKTELQPEPSGANNSDLEKQSADARAKATRLGIKRGARVGGLKMQSRGTAYIGGSGSSTASSMDTSSALAGSSVPSQRRSRQLATITPASAPALSPEQLAQAKETFEIVDDNSGSISVGELEIVMKSLGFNPTRGEAEIMVREADVDNNGELDVEELVRMITTHSVFNDHLEKQSGATGNDGGGSTATTTPSAGARAEAAKQLVKVARARRARWSSSGTPPRRSNAGSPSGSPRAVLSRVPPPLPLSLPKRAVPRP